VRSAERGCDARCILAVLAGALLRERLRLPQIEMD